MARGGLPVLLHLIIAPSFFDKPYFKPLVTSRSYSAAAHLVLWYCTSFFATLVFAEERLKHGAHFDIAILGAGLAGLCLARQTLLRAKKKILLLERSPAVPAKRQKLGESTVQVGGYYLSKVLDLEEYLMRHHFLKYNLRFYWKRPGSPNRSYEQYDTSYIRALSNVAGYQVNRNTLEAELLRLNTESSQCVFHAGVNDLDVSLAERGPHSLRFSVAGKQVSATADWVVDTTGRSRFLSRRMELGKASPVRHGSSYVWVEGLVNLEKLTDLSLDEILTRTDRRSVGHFPLWLATNHFVGEGFWFWIIPLHGKTSLGLVYDRNLFDAAEVDRPEKLIRWICKEFPVLARDLPRRKILDQGLLRDFAYDCSQTIHPSRWALSGESGRFSDPLYSPGTDLIAFHNTLILDCILTRDEAQLRKKISHYEPLVRSLYQAYIPSYELSYDALGDQEAFILKYTWELAVYFTFFVFPFINRLFTDQDFVLPYLSKLARLGRINASLQAFISAFYQWKKRQEPFPHEPVAFDFTQIAPLKNAEALFYQIGLSSGAALDLLDEHLGRLKELARYIVAHASSRVVGQKSLLTNRAFVESIRLNQVSFDPEAIRAHWSAAAAQTREFQWSFDPHVLSPFHRESNETVDSSSPRELARLTGSLGV
jgi:flavin-dependent dehydrogenase